MDINKANQIKLIYEGEKEIKDNIIKMNNILHKNYGLMDKDLFNKYQKFLDNINTWYQLLIEYIDLSTKEMIWLVNKNDLISDNKILTEEQIEKKSKDLQLDYYEVSAKTGDNIEYSIKNLVKKLIKRCNDNSFDNFDKSTQDSNDVNDNDNPGKKCNIF